MATAEATMSKRDRHIGRLRERYPDKKFEDDEEIYGQIGEDYDNYENEIAGYKESEKKMSDMFSADPRSAQFLAEWSRGENPFLSLLKYFGPDIKEVLEDEGKMKEVSEAWAKDQERIAKSKQLDDEYAKNMEASLQAMDEFKQERGLSDEQCDEMIVALFKIVQNGVIGIFDKSCFEFALNSINHDSDVATAQEEGVVAGKNQRVTEKLRKSGKGDGVGALGGKNGRATSNQGGDSLFDLASQAM